MFKEHLFCRRTFFIALLLGAILTVGAPVNLVKAQDPDLQITGQQIDPAQVEPGGKATVHFTLENTGEGPANNVELTATLSAGIQPVAGEIQSPEGLQPATTDQTVQWNLSQVPPAQPKAFVLPIQVTEAAVAGNSTIELAYKSDEQPGDAPAVVHVTIAPPTPPPTPKLQIADQQIEPPQVEMGGKATVHFTLENTGEGPANDVEVTATLPPAGIQPVASEIQPQEGLQAAVAGQPVRWSLGQLPPNQSKEFVLPVQATEGVDTASPQNIQIAYGSNEQPDNAPVVVSVTITTPAPPPTPNLEITAQPIEPPQVEPGGKATVHFTLENTGEGPANNVGVTAILPAGIQPAAGEIQPQEGLQPITPGQPVQWNLGQLPPAQPKEFVLPIQVTEVAAAGNSTIELTYKSDEVPNNEPVSVSVTITVPAPPPTPNLEITAQPIEPLQVEPGQKVTVHFTLENSGEGPANNVEVTVTLPVGFELVAGEIQSPGGLQPATPGQPVQWRLGQLPPAQPKEFVLPIQVTEAAVAGNSTIELTYRSDEVPNNEPVSVSVTIAKPSSFFSSLFSPPLIYYLIAGILVLLAILLIILGLLFGPLKQKQPASAIPVQPDQQPALPSTAPRASQPLPSPGAVTPYLEYHAPSGEKKQVPLKNLDNGGEVIGRAMAAEGITLRIDDSFPGWQSVSRHHAHIYRDPGTGRVVIKDTGSQNGVYVNGHRTEFNALKDGWPVKIGGVEFVYRDSQMAQTPSPAGQQPV